MKILKMMLLILVAGVVVGLVAPHVAQAAMCGNVEISTPGLNCGTNSNPIFGLMEFVINFLIKLLIPVAVLIIVVSGIQYIVSQGEPTAVKNAKTRILNAVIGLVLLTLLFAIINLIRQ